MLGQLFFVKVCRLGADVFCRLAASRRQTNHHPTILRLVTNYFALAPVQSRSRHQTLDYDGLADRKTQYFAHLLVARAPVIGLACCPNKKKRKRTLGHVSRNATGGVNTHNNVNTTTTKVFAER